MQKTSLHMFNKKTRTRSAPSMSHMRVLQEKNKNVNVQKSAISFGLTVLFILVVKVTRKPFVEKRVYK